MTKAFNVIAQCDSRASVRIGETTKTLSILGLVFLPGTFVSVRYPLTFPATAFCSFTILQALFGMSFFDFDPGSDTEPPRWTMSRMFWVYWIITIPATLLTILLWRVWQPSSYGKPKGNHSPNMKLKLKKEV